MNMEGKRILIVEDDDTNRKVFARMTKIIGFLAESISTVACAEDALKLLETQNFDVLLTDNNMGAMTGLELIVQCKTQLPKMKAILMSGKLELLKSEGKIPDGLLTIGKPIEGLVDLAAVIEKALE